MKVKFAKYHGNGNDFIIVDGINNNLNEIDQDKIKYLCNRNTGVGSDGFIIIKSSTDCDFEIVYYNSDGKIGSFCGNGARCAYHYSHKNGIAKRISKFKACDGFHIAHLTDHKIKVSINEVNNYKKIGGDFFVDTGSPHLVKFNQDLESLNIHEEFINSQKHNILKNEDVNVNFVSKKNNNTFLARTFERGVYAETLSCGTGAVAIAICAKLNYNLNDGKVNIITNGGDLIVNFKKDKNRFFDILLEGNAIHVFDGTFYL